MGLEALPILSMLLSGDNDWVGPVIGGLGAAVAAIVATAAKRRKQQQRVPHRGKENKMTFVPIITGGGAGAFSPVDLGATKSGHVHPVAVLWFIIFLLVSMIAFVMGLVSFVNENVAGGIVGMSMFIILLIVAILFITCLKVADQWDRVVVLRLGKFKCVQQPGMFWLAPFIDTVACWIDTRVMSTDLVAEETLTRDTVPVDVDAVMFWLVYDAKKAALEVEDFQSAVTWASQTALRDLIGKTELAELLVGRDVLDSKLQELIDSRTEPWGVTVQSVEIREIKIPRDLQDTMSRQAQAERERQARVILGESEKQIAQSFADAAEHYADNPTALHLRAMNMLFEGLKEKGSLMIVPSSALDSMNLGALGGLASMGENAAKMTGDNAFDSK